MSYRSRPRIVNRKRATLTTAIGLSTFSLPGGHDRLLLGRLNTRFGNVIRVESSKGESLPDAVSVYDERFRTGTIVLRHFGVGHQFGRFQDWTHHHI